MPFKKGQSGNPNGRPKGAQNKLQNNVVNEILEVHEKLKKEGKGLLACAKQDPKWFLSLFLKGLIPKNIEIGFDPENPMKLKVEFIESE